MGDFNKDIVRGTSIEDEILAILRKAYPTARKSPPGTMGYDIMLFAKSLDPLKHTVVTIEVKADFFDSPNFAFEFEGRGGKPTGILATEATYWIQYRKGFYYVWKTAELRAYLDDFTHHHFIRRCGDDKASRAWVMPEKKVLMDCEPLAIIPRYDKKLTEVIK